MTSAVSSQDQTRKGDQIIDEYSAQMLEEGIQYISSTGEVKTIKSDALPSKMSFDKLSNYEPKSSDEKMHEDPSPLEDLRHNSPTPSDRLQFHDWKKEDPLNQTLAYLKTKSVEKFIATAGFAKKCLEAIESKISRIIDKIHPFNSSETNEFVDNDISKYPEDKLPHRQVHKVKYKPLQVVDPNLKKIMEDDVKLLSKVMSKINKNTPFRRQTLDHDQGALNTIHEFLNEKPDEKQFLRDFDRSEFELFDPGLGASISSALLKSNKEANIDDIKNNTLNELKDNLKTTQDKDWEPALLSSLCQTVGNAIFFGLKSQIQPLLITESSPPELNCKDLKYTVKIIRNKETSKIIRLDVQAEMDASFVHGNENSPTITKLEGSFSIKKQKDGKFVVDHIDRQVTIFSPS